MQTPPDLRMRVDNAIAARNSLFPPGIDGVKLAVAEILGDQRAYDLVHTYQAQRGWMHIFTTPRRKERWYLHTGGLGTVILQDPVPWKSKDGSSIDSFVQNRYEIGGPFTGTDVYRSFLKALDGYARYGLIQRAARMWRRRRTL